MSHRSYRPEIDGLRAIAVMPVLFYHAGLPGFSAGYLGVDIFFVISGFLITSILIGDLERGDFSIARFYERRARRILPLLLVVIAATLAAGPFFLWPWQLSELGQSAVAALAFISNIFFLGQVDYFRTDAEIYPLLHTWSLAVEEQYYLFAPILLWIAWKAGRAWRGAALAALTGAIILGSLGLSLLHWPGRANEIFYLLPYRAWEIGLGALGAGLVHRHGLAGGVAGRAMAMSGLTVILASLLFLGEAGQSPVLKIPLLVAVMAILISSGTGAVGQLLSNPAVRGIGLVSYSLYLWHQPVFAYAKIHLGSLTTQASLSLIALVLLLSITSWRWIEQPFRKGPAGTATVLRRSGIAIAAMIVLAGGASLDPTRLAPVAPRNADLAVSLEARGEYVRSGYRKSQNLPFPENRKRNLLIIGDSFSQDLYNMGRETESFRDFNISTYYIPARCQPYFGPEDPEDFWPIEFRQRCRKSVDLKKLKPFLKEADIILLAANWRPWSAKRLDDIVSSLELSDDQDLVILGAKLLANPRAYSLMDYRHLDQAEREKAENTTTRYFDAARHATMAHKDRLSVVDFQALLCRKEGTICPVFTDQGRLISYDGTHLTQAGAKWAGRRLFDHSMMKDLFERKAATRPVGPLD